jgi:serine/threonine-protein kinase
MAFATEELRLLDRLLDEALELAPGERDSWLDRLEPACAGVAPALRELLAREGTRATADLIDRPPSITQFAAALLAQAPAEELGAGTVIGPYRLLRELGVGGMGVVWLAERADGLIERPVALKLPLFSIHHRVLAERFGRERVILARLAHPNIARLYDAGVSGGGQPYLALEYVEGEPLTAWCDSRQSSVRERLALISQVLRAVQYAHANLVIHRDLKPSNMLVTAAGEVRLLDFGIAKLVSDEGESGETELTKMAGRALTPHYAAPEMISGEPISIASDVYSIGVILYELLTGARPYRPRDESRGALEAAVRHDDPVRPSLAVTDDAAQRRGVESARKHAALLAGDLDTIMLKALKKKPEDRYPTAEAMVEDVERHLRGEAIEARADSTLYRTGKALRRHRVAFSAAGLVAIALVAGASVAVWQAQEARREAARANAVQDFLLDLFRANSADQADPARARQTTARELLDIGSARIHRSLGDQPQARVEILATLAQLYAELGLWSEGGELAAARTELARSLFGANDLRVAAAISDEVPFMELRETTETADRLIEEALRIHDLHGDQTSVARARLHERISNHYVDKKIPASVEHAERAVAIYRTGHPDDRGFPGALAALGDTQMRRGDTVTALATYEEALGVARRVKVPDHELLYYLHRAGEKSAWLDRSEQADTFLREALAMSERIHGAKHPQSTLVRSTLALNLLWSSRIDEAAKVADQVVADTLSAGHPEPVVLRDRFRMMFYVYWTHGDLAAARDVNSAALATYEASPPDTFVRGELLQERAMIEAGFGQPHDALATLAEAEGVANRLELPRTSIFRGNIASLKARYILVTGDARAALALLEEQGNYWHAGDEGMAGSRIDLASVRVSALLALGEVEQARRVAREAEEELAQAPNVDKLVGSTADVELMLGRVLMADRSWRDALPHVERGAEAYARVRVAESPDRAEAEALRAVCLAHLGHTEEALAALGRARAAEAKHGYLGERLRVPIREAEALTRASGTTTVRRSRS